MEVQEHQPEIGVHIILHFINKPEFSLLRHK